MHIWIYQSWLQLYDLLYSGGENSSYLMYLLGGVNELMCVNYLSNNWHVCSGKLNKQSYILVTFTILLLKLGQACSLLKFKGRKQNECRLCLLIVLQVCTELTHVHTHSKTRFTRMYTCDFPVIELLFSHLAERQHLMIPSNIKFLI